ncbi:(NiFe)-hydrogenase-3-type complex Eha, membrane protein EhaE [Methanobacterium lacus]|uniref:(NiFe)-hydrogenase-3-type complex Eha, membrane protein EhaE n=1 Tax=Methanobacterium lacus (strain AL-21) TaxID=877455 RepID=F0T708_METLA|nr:EhaE family protein [Methanobacterium lacus]ADZ09528.1 (NiFe)-hydrogenase-3-type complex Eha, membrane protein EhaE [Methanobacterium lacus]
MLDVYVWFYTGCILVIVGSIATVIGPGVKDPVVRTINTEIPAVGISMIFLTYNHTIALVTFIAATAIITLILLRAVVRLEEMGAEL